MALKGSKTEDNLKAAFKFSSVFEPLSAMCSPLLITYDIMILNLKSSSLEWL